jgi:PAS domain S-box-containing protein
MNPKILFVDDEINVLDAIQRSLRNQFIVDTAVGGHEALRKLSASGPYAVVVADMQMPEMSGLEFLCRVQMQSPDAVRMMLTGNSTLKTAVDAVNDGHVFRFLTKPCPAQTLAPALNAGIEQYDRVTSQRRKVELAIQSGEEQMRLILEAANDGVWEYRFAEKKLFWSERMYEMLGCSRETFQPTPDTFLALMHPDDRQDFQQLFQDTFASSERFQVQFRAHRRDKALGHFIGRGRAVLDATRKPVRILASTTDITNLLQAEERVLEQATLLDQAQDAILVRDLDGSIRYWNKSAERVFGWSAEEALGRKVQDFLYEEPKLYHGRVAAVLDKDAWAGEVLKRTKAGPPVTIEARWTLVRDKSGLPKSILAINTDITEKKQVQEHLFRAQRMDGIGALAGGIAHDLNNVFNPIILGIDLLKLEAKSPSAIELLEIMEMSGQRGINMVKQVLQFARGVEGQRFTIKPEKLLKEILGVANETFPKSIRIRASASADTWNVSGDPTQLHQVLLNLCVNARDAMPDGGSITISAANFQIDEQFAVVHPNSHPGPYVAITVADSGIGMPPEVIEKIFDPFFTTKGIGKGTGLGLFTSLAIVKSHGGFVLVESNPGCGTTFTFYLPASPECAETEPPLPVAELPHGHNELILLIDDEAAIRSITSQTLQAGGYRVLTASDGAEGIGVYARRAAEIAAVLVDMGMPVMGGDAAIQVLLRLNSAARIIAVSGLSSAGENDRAPEGAKCFLLKPYTAETLLIALRKVLRTPSEDAHALRDPGPLFPSDSSGNELNRTEC